MFSFFSKIFSSSKKQTSPTPVIQFLGKAYTPQSGEPVLDTLLRNGHPIPHSCRSGACQSCMMVATPETRSAIPAAAQAALSQAEKDQGCFLACSAYVNEPIAVDLPDSRTNPTITTEVVEIKPLNEQIIGLTLRAPLAYQPGQFINLYLPIDGGDPALRSYSLASVSNEQQHLDLHIKLQPGGKTQQWLAHAKSGDQITIDGPHGLCYLTEDQVRLPTIILAGVGTGLAPLYGIVQDAINQNYSGKLILLVGARSDKDLYLVNELSDLAIQHANLECTLLVQQQSQAGPWQEGDIYEYAQGLSIDYSRTCAFVCGGESFVQKMKKALFMKGTSMRNIFADTFVKAG